MHHMDQEITIKSFVSGVMGDEETHQEIQQAPQIVYIEEQNSLGKFIPNLLLKQQLQTVTDNQGNTLLHHMCSYNSPYLTLYIDSLENNHEHFNKPNNHGMTVLDIAAMYCSGEIFKKLKEKGSKDSVSGSDYWAIRGANLQCWSGNVPVQRKQLIHWAAYNDLPDVLKEFHRCGANLNQPDTNGTLPVDTALINKSYKSFEYLLSLGFDLSNPQKLKDVDSLSMSRMYKKFKRGGKQRSLDPIIPLCSLLSIQGFLVSQLFYLPLIIAIIYCILRCVKFQGTVNLENERNFSFESKLLKTQVHYGKSHFFYITFLSLFFISNLILISKTQINGYFSALIYIITFVVEFFLATGILVQIFAVVKNLTNVQMFSSHKCPYLYKPISVVASSKLAVHTYKNPYDKGIVSNIKEYLKLC